eukprot:scaffold3830_cov85-Cylindrotheca_fusiformis.AAC.7
MLDWNGEMVEPRDRQTVMLSDIEETELNVSSLQVSSVESSEIDRILSSDGGKDSDRIERCYQSIPGAADQVSSVLQGISPTLDDVALYERLSARSEIGAFATSIGSTNATEDPYLFDEDMNSQDPSTFSDDQQDSHS